MEQAPTNFPPLTEAEIRAILAQMSQAMTTQAQDATIQAQPMTTQAYRDIALRPFQQVTTMASHLRDFSLLNPPTLYGCKFDEDY